MALSPPVLLGSDNFVREVEGLMKPGTSALFVLDDEGDMDVILHNIRGLGGTVLKTNVEWGGRSPVSPLEQPLRPVGPNPASSRPDVFAGAMRYEIRSSCASS